MLIAVNSQTVPEIQKATLYDWFQIIGTYDENEKLMKSKICIN